MIISNDSPLRHLPIDSKRRDVLFSDAIRVSVDMAELTLGRLRGMLRELALGQISNEYKQWALILAAQDAWSLIDSFHRLSSLLQGMPGLKQKTPELLLFYQLTAVVEALRNSVQHFKGDITKLAASGDPIGGRLSWVTIKNVAEGELLSSTIVLGSLFPSTHRLLNPLAGQPDASGTLTLMEVDCITLSSGGNVVRFEPLFERLVTLVRHIEHSLRERSVGVPTTSSDTMANVLLILSPENSREAGQDIIGATESLAVRVSPLKGEP